MFKNAGIWNFSIQNIQKAWPPESSIHLDFHKMLNILVENLKFPENI